MDDLLKIEDLKISYYTYAGEVQSVRGVSFSVRRVRHLHRGRIRLRKICDGQINYGADPGASGGNQGREQDSAEREEPAGTVGKEWESYRGARCAWYFRMRLRR